MERATCLLFLALFINWPIFSQSDSITVLEEVLLDAKLKDFSTGQTLLHLSESEVKQNRPLLTNLLNFHTPIYFKENGLGMVSSASFRGTTASQTAVLWNGININSQFNGQTDFNTINAAGFDQIAVRGGGGSVVYGTGAIGGTVHLNNELSFRERLEHDVFLGYGSFNTLDARYQLEAARGKWSMSLSGARNSSDNDYEYPAEKGHNINGQFYNNAINLGVAYQLNRKNTFRFFGGLFEGERHFSLIRPSETKTKYNDLNGRYLLEWESEFSKFTSVTKLAFLDENYQFYGNIASENHSFGKADSFIAKHDLTFSISEDFQLNSVLTNTHINGKGSDIEESTRNIFSAAVLMKHRLNEQLSYEAGLRKEASSDYESPFLFSTGANYRASDFYNIKLHVSRNFRIPTFNDLYWTGAGNLSLKPETSLQAELGHRLTWRNVELNVTGYYNDIEDMIRWIPGNGGFWHPENLDEVETYGVETMLDWKKRIGNQGFLRLKGSYSYTESRNKITGHQLIYVPYHKATATANYSHKRWEVDYQFLYTGELYTRSDNNSRYNLSAYSISNIGMSYSFGNDMNYRLGGRLNNLFDEEYQNVEDRWMPGFNYTIYLNLKF